MTDANQLHRIDLAAKLRCMDNDCTPGAKQAHVLLTNDDGMDSPFLQKLLQSLSEHFRVTVAAPAREQSWIGRAYSRHCDVTLKTGTLLGHPAYTIGGTPSDCVNIVLGHVLNNDLPDAVVSGLNIGFNCTMPAMLSSGTLAGAIEGAHWGLPAVAFSQTLDQATFAQMADRPNPLPEPMLSAVSRSANHSVYFVKQLLASPPVVMQVHNVNFPLDPPESAEFIATQPNVFQAGTFFEKVDDNTFRFRYTGKKPVDKCGEDTHTLRAGQISHSILRLDQLGRQ